MRDRVVEVARMLAVDRDGHQRPEVRAACDVLLLHGAADAARFLDRLGAVLVGNAVFADDDLVVDARLVDVAEHLDDPAERAARRASAIG